MFYAPRLRDFVMHPHEDELIDVHWTRPIESGWTCNVVAKKGADADGIRARLGAMRDAVAGWEAPGDTKHVDKFAPSTRYVAL